MAECSSFRRDVLTAAWASRTFDTEIYYLTSAVYAPEQVRGMRYDDPAVGIRWPMAITAASEQDRNWPLVGG
jgi:dTDP-4-dehydrorhamnose 3,5-epimerase